MTIKNEFDSYWKKDEYNDIHRPDMYSRLKKLGYNVSRSDTKAQLVSIYRRHHEEVPRYDKCSTTELMKFGIDRKIHLFTIIGDLNEKDNRDVGIQSLQDADDSKKFERFLDLPPELRVRVFELYVAEFPNTLKYPTRPPLARTCRILRREVSPIFFANCEFEIHLKQYSARPRTFREETRTRLFLSELDTVDVVSIRRLKLVLIRTQRYLHSSTERQVVCHIKLEKAQLHQVKVLQNDSRQTRWLKLGQRSRLKSEVSLMLERLKVVDGRKRFELQDVHGLRRAVETAVSN